MNIMDAYKKAQAAGETCIGRSTGLMHFRYLQPTRNGCLMPEKHGPLSDLTPVTDNYSLRPDDLLATDWNVAADKELSSYLKLESVSNDEVRTDPIEEVLKWAYIEISKTTVPAEVLDLAKTIDVFTKVKLKLQESGKVGSENDDSQ